MTPEEAGLRSQLARAEEISNQRLEQNEILCRQIADAMERLAEAAKVIKPFAEARKLYGQNEREEVSREFGALHTLEVRHLTAALEWMKEGGNV